MIVGFIWLVISTVFLYLAFLPVQTEVVGIIDGIFDLQELGQNVSSIAEVAEGIPTSFIDPIRPHLNLLSVAIILPAALAGLLLLASAGLAYRNPAKTCCAKTLAALAYVFLLLALVLAIILAALAIVLNYQENAQEFVNIAVSLCEDNIPTWTQTISDATAARDRASENGVDTTEFDTQINNFGPALASLDDTCGHITDLLNTFPALFIPGMTSVLCILYLYISTITMCCSAKCLRSPVTTPTITTPTKGNDIQEV